MPSKLFHTLALSLVLGVPAALVAWRLLDPEKEARKQESSPVAAVAVATIEHRRIEDRRTFSGNLIARAEFTVAPKIAGRIETLKVDIGDPVSRGAVVAELDDDEVEQSALEAQAALEVARAKVTVANSGLVVAESELGRVQRLHERGISSDSELDVATANRKARTAEVTLAEAEVKRAEAVLETRRVRLRYAKVAATWPGTDALPRFVSERHVDEGANVAVNDPIVTVVDLSVVRAVLFVTERDYARLAHGQAAKVRTDAFPGVTFAGEVERLAPVFEESSRQARVEVRIDNPDHRLKPGMYVRVTVVLAAAESAAVVPVAAMVRRNAGPGVFVVAPSGDRVRFVAVRAGITSGDHVQVFGDGLTGRVVTLGQQMLEDGAAIRIPAARAVGAEAGQ